MPDIYEENKVEEQIHIAKAIGWYISVMNSKLNYKQYRQKKIAGKMHLSDAALSRKIIKPNEAGHITDSASFKAKDKRTLEISEAKEICRIINTSLTDVLYFYQHREFYEKNLQFFDKLQKLTNKLTISENDLDDIDNDISEVERKEASMISRSSDFITNVMNPEFIPWFGKYYCYFSSTSSDEAGKRRVYSFDRHNEDPEMQELLEVMPDDYIFCGILNVLEGKAFDDEYCHVDFKFLADPNKGIVKKYHGILMISKIRNGVFCELIGDEEGEISYLIIEKKEVGRSQPQVKCSMAMALTVSSKAGHRRPCCERMVISRERIKEGTEEYKALKASLLMNDNIIRVTRWGYDELIKEIEESEDSSLKEIIKKFPGIQSFDSNVVPVEECAFIPETYIRQLNTLPIETRRKFEVMLRSHSIASWYYKTKADKADDLIELIEKTQLSI